MSSPALFSAIATSLTLIKPLRSINGILADAVQEEEHEDEAVTTDHPVEQGTVITDHMYKLPAILHLTYVWSIGGQQNRAKDPTFLRGIYSRLLQLQVDRTLFQVFTGKRIYKNMALTNIALTTDHGSENILAVRITCKEIILVTTQILQLTDAVVQTLPSRTAPVLNLGDNNLVGAPNFNTGAPPLP